MKTSWPFLLVATLTLNGAGCGSSSSSPGDTHQDGGVLHGDAGGDGDGDLDAALPHDASDDADDGTDAGADGGEDAADDAGSDAGEEPSEPQVLVPALHLYGHGRPTIAVDEEYVYWTGAWVGPNPSMPLPPATGNYVLRVPKAGGDVSALYESGDNALSEGFAMDATSIYVSQGVDVLTSKIIKVAKDGSGAEDVTTIPPHGNEYAIVGQTLYFAAVGSPGDIDSVPLAGGSVTALIDESTTAHPDGFTYFPAVNGLTTDGTNLYYSGNADGMFQAPLGGGTPLLLHARNMDGANVSHGHSYPGVKDGFVYWQYYGYIYKVAVGGGDVETVVEPLDGEAGGADADLRIDGDYVYYVNNGGLKKVRLDGSGRATVLAGSAGYSVSGLAVDDTSAYMFMAAAQGMIRVPK